MIMLGPLCYFDMLGPRRFPIPQGQNLDCPRRCLFQIQLEHPIGMGRMLPWYTTNQCHIARHSTH